LLLAARAITALSVTPAHDVAPRASFSVNGFVVLNAPFRPATRT